MHRYLKNKTGLQNIGIILCLFICFVFFQTDRVDALENSEHNLSNDEVKLKITLTPSYVLGPGDQLTITDRTLKDISGQVEKYDLTVASDGYISVPLPDGTQQNILAAGNTLDELATEIRTLFGKTLQNPLVFLQISRYRAINVYIAGEVAKPGVYKIESTSTQSESGKTTSTAISTFGLTLASALQLAGGLKPYADITSVALVRGGLNSEKKIVNLKSFFDPNIAVQDFNLQSGDTVYVSKTDKYENQAQSNVLFLGKLAYQEVPVSVVGEVKSPSNFIVSNDSTIFDAIGKAGGPNEVGTIRKVRLARFDDKGIYKWKEYDLHDLITHGTTFEEIALRPNDRIEVEASKGKEIRHFFKNNAGTFISPVLNQLGNFIVEDSFFNRITRGNGFSRSTPFGVNNSAGISIINAPPGQ